MWSAAVLSAAALTLAALPARAATPIPEGPGAAALPVFQGAPAAPAPVPFREPPRHPFMAANGRSNLHVDGFQTDVNAWSGPLGRDMTTTSNFFARECASIAFDRRGRIVTLCVGLEAPVLQLIDPVTLDVLAQMPFPPRQLQTTGSVNPFTNFSGGGYFYLDERDRVVAPTTTRHVVVVAETAGPGFEQVADHDLTAAVPVGDSIISALPDWRGRIWFVSTGGVVGTIDPGSGAVRSVATGEPIGNSFAVGPDGGVYIVTDAALYRFDADADGAPAVSWREAYANDGVKKSGQSQAGSGTTPTLMGPSLVAITDNDDPVNVVVYRRARSVEGDRVVCRRPIFTEGQSSTDQSLVATATSIVTENNYGYGGPQSTEQGASVTGGVERIDLDPGGGCHTAWHSDVKAPTSVPKLSAGNGLVYVWSKPEREDGNDAWYLTALDFRTGQTVYSRLAGEGLGFNNNYAPVTLGPDGTAYMGVLGGIVRLADATPPPQPVRSTPKGRVRLAIRRVRRSGADRACELRAVVARLRGPGTRRVRWVSFRFGRARGADRRAPFQRRLAPRRTGRLRLTANVHYRSGARGTISRRIRVCRS